MLKKKKKRVSALNSGVGQVAGFWGYADTLFTKRTLKLSMK